MTGVKPEQLFEIKVEEMERTIRKEERKLERAGKTGRHKGAFIDKLAKTHRWADVYVAAVRRRECHQASQVRSRQ